MRRLFISSSSTVSTHSLFASTPAVCASAPAAICNGTWVRNCSSASSSGNNVGSNSGSGSSSSSRAEDKVMATTPEATSLREARRQAFLESQAEWNRIHRQQESEREERLRRQQATNSGLSKSNTKVVTDVQLGKKKGPWGSYQLRDAWSSDAMSRHEKDSIDKRLGSENRFNPFERDRRIARMLVWSAPPLWSLGLCVAYYFITGKYPWEADYQHLLNVLRQFDQSPRSKLYMYRPDGSVKRDRRYAPGDEASRGQRAY